MADPDYLAIGTLIIRVSNALLWTFVCYRIVSHDKSISRLARQLIVSVLIFGMWILVFGSLTQFGIGTGVARPLYTAFTAYAGLIALAILMDREGP